MATLEKLAMWQGVEKYSKNLTQPPSPFYTMYTEVYRARIVATATAETDFYDVNRALTKRMTPDERNSINEALFNFNGGFQDPGVLMRAVVLIKLNEACGRRGEDLREVRIFFILNTTTKHCGQLTEKTVCICRLSLPC